MHALPHWEYNGATGPQQWGSLCEEYATADSGKQQSPIDIPAHTHASPSLGQIQYSYHDAPAVIENNGHTIQVTWGGGKLFCDGQSFDLKQFHFHSPSEHTLDGRTYPLEMHLVHMNPENKQLAVIAVLFEAKEEGRENPFLAQFFPNIPPIESVGNQTPLGVVCASLLGLDSAHYYRYNGSLTTPPCSEGVVWTIMKHVQGASLGEIEAFVDANHVRCGGCPGNARPVQPPNGRAVVHFDS